MKRKCDYAKILANLLTGVEGNNVKFLAYYKDKTSAVLFFEARKLLILFTQSVYIANPVIALD
ncbi:hypothetical protein DVH26_21750 [Paenibacillus sp. H1-7]|nr:hypothetical protein DVH26_21750 [Paenibacillus sp. H1-7]